jgi:hypothetical protein
LSKFNGAALYAGAPGSITEYVANSTAFGGQPIDYEGHSNSNYQLNALTQVLVKPTDRAGATTAEAWFDNKTYTYRTYAFYNLLAAEAGGGNVCSGSLVAATRATSAADITVATIPPAIISLAVLNLRQSLYDQVRPIVSAKAPGIVGSGDRDAISWGLTDQVVNCFLTYQPGGCNLINPQYVFKARNTLGLSNQSSIYGWGNPGGTLAAGTAVAPDHIVLSAGRTSVSPFATPTQASLPHFNGTFWASANLPPASVYLPSGGAAYTHNNAGPWNGAALVKPTYSGGYWTNDIVYTPSGCTPDAYTCIDGWCPYQP